MAVGLVCKGREPHQAPKDWQAHLDIPSNIEQLLYEVGFELGVRFFEANKMVPLGLVQRKVKRNTTILGSPNLTHAQLDMDPYITEIS